MEFSLSIHQCLNLIAASGAEKTYLIEGPMGSGKSSIINLARERFGDKYNYVVVDCTQWDVGDVQIPAVDLEAQVTKFLPNLLLVGDGTKPMMVLLDEVGKASRPVQNALLPVMLERRVGVRKMFPGSVVFGATNLGAEGVGDLFQAHACNRLSFIEMRGPTSEEWIEWAVLNDVPPAMLVFAKEEGARLFQSFKDVSDPKDNPYIFHPRDKRRSFVTPRSLYLAGIELRDDVRKAVGDDKATTAAIAGNIGFSAALDLMTYVKLQDKLPAWELVINHPDTAPTADDSPAAAMMTVYRAVGRVTEETLDNVITYIQRLPKELQVIFARNVMKDRRKQAFVALNRNFAMWCTANHWLFK